jgi:hypothetical protein
MRSSSKPIRDSNRVVSYDRWSVVCVVTSARIWAILVGGSISSLPGTVPVLVFTGTTLPVSAYLYWYLAPIQVPVPLLYWYQVQQVGIGRKYWYLPGTVGTGTKMYQYHTTTKQYQARQQASVVWWDGTSNAIYCVHAVAVTAIRIFASW